MPQELAASFVTGSHAYGSPGPESDIDLVIFVSKKDLDRLREMSDRGDNPHQVEYIAAGGESLRFGKLNLICCLHEGQYEVWQDGTQKLKMIKNKKGGSPVTREFAIEFFRNLRWQRGLCV